MFGLRKNEPAQPVVEQGACRHSVVDLGAVSGSCATLASSGGSGRSPDSSLNGRPSLAAERVYTSLQNAIADPGGHSAALFGSCDPEGIR